MNRVSLIVLRFLAAVILAAAGIAHATPFSSPGTAALAKSGAATYSMPLFMVPGTNGMQPNLALNYSSQGGYGMMGFGWSLSGLSAISRCARTLDQDGFRGGVNLDANDRFCFDGQRLFVHTPSSCPSGGTEYRTEIESFNRVCAYGTIGASGAPSNFHVWTKSGLKMFYGPSLDSSGAQIDGWFRPNNGEVIAWMLTRVDDRSNNYYTVKYEKGTATIGGVQVPGADMRPERIDYTGNSTSSPVLNPYASVQFSYSHPSPTYTTHAYVGGVATRSSALLNSISIWEGPNLARNYSLGYEVTGNYRHRLISVTEHGYGLVKQPTTFTYNGNALSASDVEAAGYTQTQNPHGHATGGYAGSMAYYGDFNGDGKLDVFWNPEDTLGRTDLSAPGSAQRLWLGVGPSNTQVVSSITVNGRSLPSMHGCAPLIGDFNNDGRSDILWYPKTEWLTYDEFGQGWPSWNPCTQNNLAPIEIWFSNGDGTFAAANPGEAHQWAAWLTASWRPTIADFNGDGKVDVLWLLTPEGSYGHSNPNLNATLWVGNGNGTFSGSEFAVPLAHAPHIGDFNGDGIADIFWDNKLADGRSSGAGRALWLGQSNAAFSFVATPGLPAGYTGYVPLLVDMNSDGKTDILWDSRYADGRSSGYRLIWESDGRGGIYRTITNLLGWDGWAGWTLSIGDLNGDGRPDLVWDLRDAANRSMGTRIVNLNLDGESFYNVTNNLASANTGYVGTINILADFNGDGKADILFDQTDIYGRSMTQMGLYTSTTPPRDLLVSVTDGLRQFTAINGGGPTVTFSYVSLTNSGGHYIKWTGAAYPNVDVIGPMYVANSMTVRQGASGTHTTRQYYFGARAHLRGRGFLGFRTVTVEDGTTLMHSQTYFRQDYPYIGLPEVSYSLLSPSYVQSVGTTNFYYNAHAFGGTRYFPYLQHEYNQRFELNGAFISRTYTTKTLDLYGNATQVAAYTQNQAGTNNGDSKVTVSAFTNTESTWTLGRLNCSAVTSTVPGTPTLTRVSGFGYAANGLLNSETIEPGTACAGVTGTTDPQYRVTTTYGRDAWGNITTKALASAVAAGQPGYFAPRTESTTVFDATYRRTPATITNALGHVETRVFNGVAAAYTSITDINGLTVTHEYDSLGRKTRSVSPLDLSNGNSQVETLNSYYTCNWSGCEDYFAYGVSTTTKVVGATTKVGPDTNAYADLLGRPFRAWAQESDGTTWKMIGSKNYDVLGRVSFEYRPANDNNPLMGQCCPGTGYLYDLLGRNWNVWSTDPYNITATTTVSVNTYAGLITTVQHLNGAATGQLTERQANALGQLVRVTQAQGSPRQTNTTYTYDAYGNLKTTTAPDGSVTTINYDVRGRKTQMVEPNTGTTTYVYDALGQLIRQTDAKGQITTMAYDLLGRLQTRTEPDLISNFYFDTVETGCSATSKVKGMTTRATTSTGFVKRVCTDALGRPITETTVTGGTPAGPTMVVSRTYDAAGRPATLTYPNSFRIQYNYNNTTDGSLLSIQEFGGAALWTLPPGPAPNATTHTVLERAGNNIETRRTYDLRGRLTGFTVGTSAALTSIQNATVAYDYLNNVTGRTWYDGTATRSETFAFDELNRITGVTGPANKTFAYNLAGNLTSKTGIGTYTYPAAASARPHAVSSVTGTVNGVTNPVYAYDANGNLLTEKQGTTNRRALTWASYNLPTQIAYTPASGTGATANFLFGPGHERVRQTLVQGATTTTTHYLGGPHYEQVTNSSTGITEYKAYVHAAGRIVALKTTRSNATNDLKYFHDDHLGSTSILTNANGTVAERLSYDVWGKRRNVNGTDAAITATQNRGYTGHEHLDAVSLIHMNGRVYEPNLGRFTGADPIVHAAGDGQSYNRYAYVRNNPLKYTDPSGYDLWSDIVDGGRKLLQENWAERQVDRVETFMARYGETIVVVVLAAAITYASGFVLSELGGSMIAEAALLAEPGVAATSATGAGLVSAAPTAAAAVGGYAAGYMQSGGDPRVAARSALSAALLAYAGGLGSDGYGQFAARVIGGGVNGYLQTGNRKGFYRGLAAGAIPDNLGFPSAYRDIWWANLSIGIVRDGIRGSIAEDSSDGFWKGVAYGQATSAVGHLWGLASTLSLPKFQNGAFMYSANWLDGPGGVTFGNVITAGTTFMESALMVSHERDHIFNPIERALGAMYIPVHLLDLIVGNAVWALGGRCAGFFMEEWTQAHPYSSIGHYCSR